MSAMSAILHLLPFNFPRKMTAFGWPRIRQTSSPNYPSQSIALLPAGAFVSAASTNNMAQLINS